MASIYKRITNRLLFEKLKLNISTLKHLENKLHYSFKDLSTHEKIKERHQYYVENISRVDMAASLELSSVVYDLCRMTSPKKMIDIGSGFSSFILRTYAEKTPKCRVWSIDDDTVWLDKTREYLKISSLNTDNLLTLEEFVASSENEFDILLLDLNYVEVRKNYINLVVERCKQGGVILFDDVHKREFMMEVLQQTKKLPVKLYDLSAVTKDQFGRFALLGIKS